VPRRRTAKLEPRRLGTKNGGTVGREDTTTAGTHESDYCAARTNRRSKPRARRRAQQVSSIARCSVHRRCE